MDKKDLQVENGNFTRIINPLIDNLIKIPFNGCELAVAIFIIRKTYGFNKTEDEISLTQFENGVNKSRPSVILALKNLQLVKVAKLVKQGTSKKQANIWKINKYIDTWELVKVAKLVKHKHSTSKAKRFQLVKTALHTKDNIQKTYTKDNYYIQATPEESKNIIKVIDSFKGINPTINYGNKTIRKASLDLVKQFGLEGTLKYATYAASIQGQDYAPTITTPYQLKEKLAQLKIYYDKSNKSKFTSI